MTQLTDSMKRQLLRHCYTFASERSTDPSTQNGALLIRPTTYEIISLGANVFPRGVQHTPERDERPLKYSFVSHAETNAIFAAARVGIATQGLAIVCPWFPCCECGK